MSTHFLQRLCVGLALLVAAEAFAGGPVVTAGVTTYSGARSTNGTAVFRGIPFAQPPVGERRWRVPAPVESVAGPVDATQFAPGCMQNGYLVAWYHDLMRSMGTGPEGFPAPEFSEDCLYLNVWTDLAADSGRPVIVYIHGGSNKSGWSYEPNYRGAALADRGAVVVTVAYRLGVFGFLAHPDLPARNFALHDLAMALHWVRNNIAAFGGDADRITLMGESAGAANASHMMVSPLAAGLAQRLVHQSGGWQFDGLASAEDAEQRAQVLEGLLTEGNGGLDRMREATAPSVLAAADTAYQGFYFSPVADAQSLPAALGELAESGDLPGFDLLLGTNADESLMYVDADEQLDQWLAENLDATAQTAARYLLDADASEVESLSQLKTAAQFTCPSARFASAVAGAGGRVYFYRFNRVRAGLDALGAYHGAELPYVFDTHDTWLPTETVDRQLGKRMGDYWLHFAAEGNPGDAGGPPWPRWQSGAPRVLILDSKIEQQSFTDRPLCDALAGVVR